MTTYDIATNTGTNLGPITKGRRFRQQIVARDDRLSAISVWAATYQKQISSTATLTVRDAATHEVLRSASAETAAFADNTWQRFTFASIPDSRGRTFEFTFETDAVDQAITLWTNSRFGEPCWRDDERLSEAICHKSHYVRQTFEIVDAILARHASSPEPASSEQREAVSEIVRACVAQRGKHLLHLVHMLDAYARTNDVARVISFSRGDVHREALLAARFPQLELDVVRVGAALPHVDAPNVRVVDSSDVRGRGAYDFVVAIDWLEHADTFDDAFRRLARLVRPGGFLYVAVPTARAGGLGVAAADDEARDYAPNLDVEALERAFGHEGLDIVHSATMLDGRLTRPLESLLAIIDTSVVEAATEDVLRLSLLDLEDMQLSTASEARGIRYLGRKMSAEALASLGIETASIDEDENAIGGSPARGDAAAPPAIDWSNPGPLVRGVSAFARLRSTDDFFNAISVRVAAPEQAADATATLRLLDGAGRTELKRIDRLVSCVDDGSWQMFPFESISQSPGREYAFSVETDAPSNAIAIRPRANASTANAHVLDGDIEFRSHYFPSLARFLDHLLFRHVEPPPVPADFERYLDRHLFQCLKLGWLPFARLVHMADAFGRIEEPIQTVLGVGVGMGYQEAFIAGRIPRLSVLATDFVRQVLDFPMPNLRFGLLDLLGEPLGERFDFVFSVECLEHIEDDRTAFRTQAAMVKPGKYMYVSVPFASREEQQDESMRKYAWDVAEHYRLGYTFDQMHELFEENGFDVIHAANMFFCDLVLPLERLIGLLDVGTLEVAAEDIARLMLLDLSERRVSEMREAQGIRFLGRKR